MKELALLIAGFVLTATASSQVPKQGWLDDFEQLKSALATAYPSLEWHAARGMDLPMLDKRTRERLANAQDDGAARAALERFIANFGDGHLQLSWPAATANAPASTPPPRPLCARLDIPEWPDTAAIVRNAPGYQPLDGITAPISAGLLNHDGRRIGVLRVPLFMPESLICESALRQIGMDSLADCDEACRTRVSRQIDQHLVAVIAQAVQALVRAQPDVLLVDVAGNGGGNDSAIALARMLTTEPLTTPSMRFVRGPARAANLREAAAELSRETRRASAREKRFVAPLIAGLETAAREADGFCDLAALWQGQPAGCSLLVDGPFFAAGFVNGELPAEFRQRPWAARVSTTAQYMFTPAMWTGPLVVLVDAGSGSATELFAAMLRDADRARIVGAPTAGAGCGWTLERQGVELTHSRGKLYMPDCLRLRGDGSNELDGIQPDVLIGFRRFDSPKQRVERFLSALPAALK